jgi:hypothetical protein
MQHLISHPSTPAKGVAAVDVEGLIGRGRSVLEYRVIGGSVLIPETAEPIRTDGLWQTTCFELFVRPQGLSEYFEFNFAPSGQWAAYRFDSYRAGMADLPLREIAVERTADGVRIHIDLGELPPTPWQVAVTAVIAECDGTRSYWSMAHDDEKPDFHHPSGFVLQV